MREFSPDDFADQFVIDEEEARGVNGGGRDSRYTDFGADPPPEPPPEPPLPIIDLAALDGQPVPPQEWLIPDVLPLENVSLLTGHGATGKSTIAGPLSGSTVLCRGFFNHMPEKHGPALVVCCEDDPKALHRRYDAIARHYEVSLTELSRNGLVPMSFAGRDAVMAEPNERRDHEADPALRAHQTTSPRDETAAACP